MKCLTVCQPFASALMTPIEGERQPLKPVENRTWLPPMRMIGERIIIHAGKSRKWLNIDDMPDREYELLRTLGDFNQLPFGAILGSVVLKAARSYQDADQGIPFVFGPELWFVECPIVLAEPIPYKGSLGLFDVPDSILPQEVFG